MDKFEKKQANREVRKQSKKEVEKWDAEGKKGKVGKLKACPGYIDHVKQRRIELTVPCITCKRRFCSVECHDSHKPLCEAKFYFAETKDRAPLIELCKKIYNTYYKDDGCVKEEWVKKYDLRENGCSHYGHWSLQWKHEDLAEAVKILKKYEPEFINSKRKNEWF